MAVRLINTRNDSWHFRYIKKHKGKDDETVTLSLGAAEDSGVVNRHQPILDMSDDVYDQIKHQLDALIHTSDLTKTPHIRMIHTA